MYRILSLIIPIPEPQVHQAPLLYARESPLSNGSNSESTPSGGSVFESIGGSIPESVKADDDETDSIALLLGLLALLWDRTVMLPTSSADLLPPVFVQG